MMSLVPVSCSSCFMVLPPLPMMKGSSCRGAGVQETHGYKGQSKVPKATRWSSCLSYPAALECTTTNRKKGRSEQSAQKWCKWVGLKGSNLVRRVGFCCQVTLWCSHPCQR
jgi:hypothetical protein